MAEWLLGSERDELLSLEGKYRDSLLLLGLTCSLLMAYVVASEPRMATQAVVSLGIRVSLLIARTSGSNLPFQVSARPSYFPTLP